MRRQYGPRARLSTARRPLGCGERRRDEHVGQLALDDGGRARPRHGGGRDRPARAAEVYLAAIDDASRRRRIYARTTPERARAEAAPPPAARAGLRRGPLDGAPVSWKDLFDTAGVATEAGSALLSGRVPGARRGGARDRHRAGRVCLGKTHMTELAFSGLGINPMTATPPNINDPELAPGGSSSGPPPRSPSASRRRRSARTPAARCACRRPGTTSSG